MTEVLSFPHKTADCGKTLFSCKNCNCHSFKLMQYPNREEIVVRCANCENPQDGFEIAFKE